MAESNFTPLRRTLGKLSEASNEERNFHVAAEGCGFRLHPKITAIADAEEPALMAQAAKLASLEALLKERKAEHRELVAVAAVRRAFEDAGVPVQSVWGAAEHFCKRFKLVTKLGDKGQHRVTVADGFGEIDVESAVQAFLTTREVGRYSPGEGARDEEADHGAPASAAGDDAVRRTQRATARTLLNTVLIEIRNSIL